jgi:NAD(P)-dependent dehydrogenase (short-subunit alcohol dehydrogenase family)
MVKQGGGRIIQIGSISGQRGNMGGIAYGSSKAAVMHICKVLAVELSGQGVMVNAIAPVNRTGISKHGPSRKQGYSIAFQRIVMAMSMPSLMQRSTLPRMSAIG